MFDVFGSLHGVELAAWLWLVPALPLAAFLVCAYLALSAEPNAQERQRKSQLSVFRGASVSAVLVLVLVRWGHEGAQLAHLARFFRIGRFDASLDLVLDPTSLVTAAGIVVAVAAMSFSPAASPRAALCIPLLEAGALTVALADNVPTALIGGAMASTAVTMMADREVGAFALHRISDAALLLGCALLAWGLGGGFVGGEFVSDMNPRLAVASQTQEASSADAPHSLRMDDDEDEVGPKRGHKPIDLTAGGKGTLTFASLPGALVFLDDSRTPLVDPKVQDGKSPARAPLVHVSLPVGIHRLRVRAAEGTDDSVLGHVVISTATDTRILLLGPTTSLREASDQLGMKWLGGEISLSREVTAHEAWPGARLLTLACVALGLGVLLRTFAVAFAPLLWLPLAVASFGFAALLVRATPLLAYEPRSSVFVAAIAALAALGSAAIAARSYDVEGVLARTAAAKGCLVVAGIVTGAAGAGLTDLATSLVALVVLERVRRSLAKTVFAETVSAPRARSAWTIAWMIAAVSIVVSPAQAIELASAFSSSSTLPGACLFLAEALTLALLTYGLVRAASLALAPRGKKKAKSNDDEARPWVGLAAVSFALAIVVGFSSGLVGAEVSIPVALIGAGVAFAGAALARQTFAGIKSEDALAALEDQSRPLRLIWNARLRVLRIGARMASFARGISSSEAPANPPEQSSRGALSAGLFVLGLCATLGVAMVLANR